MGNAEPRHARLAGKPLLAHCSHTNAPLPITASLWRLCDGLHSQQAGPKTCFLAHAHSSILPAEIRPSAGLPALSTHPEILHLVVSLTALELGRRLTQLVGKLFDSELSCDKSTFYEDLVHLRVSVVLPKNWRWGEQRQRQREEQKIKQ